MNYLENGFRLLAVGCAMSYGYGFTPDCQMHVNQMIQNGIADLSDELSNETLLNAQKNLVQFISRMVEESALFETPSNDLKELHEPTFFNARNFLCPLPPWIKGPC